MKITQLELILTYSLRKNALSKVQLFSILYFKNKHSTCGIKVSSFTAYIANNKYVQNFKVNRNAYKFIHQISITKLCEYVK